MTSCVRRSPPAVQPPLVRRLPNGDPSVKVEPRFYFSQLSALAVIAVALFGWIEIVTSVFGPLERDAVGAAGGAAFLVGAFVFCALAIGVWRLLLVRLGLLSTKKLEATLTAVHGRSDYESGAF